MDSCRKYHRRRHCLHRHGRRGRRRRHHLRSLSSPPRCAIRRPPQGQFGNLIFGFAVTEALGIFSLLIALLLLFARLRRAEHGASTMAAKGAHTEVPGGGKKAAFPPFAEGHVCVAVRSGWC